MIDITKLEDISSTLIYNENHKELIKMETFLKSELSNAEDMMEREYVLFLYLVVKIKNNPVETDSITTYFQNYFDEIKNTKSNLSKNPELLELYLSTVIGHLQYLKRIYTDKFYWPTEEHIYMLKNDLKRELYLVQKRYWKFFRHSLYKYVLGYGRSYFNLMYTSMVNWFGFAFAYYLSDISTKSWTLYASFTGIEWHAVWPFDYYLYLSLNTLSNLWADFGLGTTPFLRIMFWVEQMAWVILTWLFIYVLGKKI